MWNDAPSSGMKRENNGRKSGESGQESAKLTQIRPSCDNPISNPSTLWLFFIYLLFPWFFFFFLILLKRFWPSVPAARSGFSAVSVSASLAWTRQWSGKGAGAVSVEYFRAEDIKML